MNEVLGLLNRNELAVNGETSEVMQEEVTFLGHVVGHKTLGMEDSKVEVVRKWKPMGQNGTKCNDSGSGALVDQGVHGDLGDRVVDRVNVT